jgi:hypothetical protein
LTNKLLAICTAAGLGFTLAWGCGDPNPRKIVKGSGGSGGDTSGSGGSDVGSGGAGAVGSGGDSGSGGVTPGTGGDATGSGGMAATGSGGDASGSGGMPATGSGGSGAGPGGGGGRAAGSGGATGMGGAVAMASDVIDNFDDNDGRILMVSGRQGPWHTFNDTSSGNQQPPVGAAFTPQAGGANGTPYAAHTTGSGYKFGGVGLDLDNATTMPEGMQSQAYNASAYSGIRFWAKGNGNLRVEFPQRSFVPTTRGGACNESTSTCWNVYGSRSAQGTLSLTDWKQVTISFSSLEREDGSKTPAFDPSQLMGIAFKHEGDTFDFWIDEVELTR